MVVRAIKGAIQLDVDEKSHLLKSTAELLAKMLHANNLDDSQLISIVFSATEDINSEFPGVAVKELGLGDVPVVNLREMTVAGSLPRTISVLINAELDVARSEVNHVYLRGAGQLRLENDQQDQNANSSY